MVDTVKISFIKEKMADVENSHIGIVAKVRMTDSYFGRGMHIANGNSLHLGDKATRNLEALGIDPDMVVEAFEENGLTDLIVTKTDTPVFEVGKRYDRRLIHMATLQPLGMNRAVSYDSEDNKTASDPTDPLNIRTLRVAWHNATAIFVQRKSHGMAEYECIDYQGEE